jgi:hypothetical protein
MRPPRLTFTALFRNTIITQRIFLTSIDGACSRLAVCDDLYSPSDPFAQQIPCATRPYIELGTPSSHPRAISACSVCFGGVSPGWQLSPETSLELQELPIDTNDLSRRGNTLAVFG